MAAKSYTPGQPLEVLMEMLDGPVEVATDAVPTMDQAAPVATHQDWRREDTRVISVAVGNSVYKGERFESRAEALREITRRHGRILEANYVPGRAFFRVMKERS